MFFSLFYVMKFFFEKPYIFTAVIFTWVPQIIYNAIYKNRMSMPIMNILLTCLNKVFLPFYFRGCPDNFFQLSYDYSFIAVCFVCIVLEVIKLIFIYIFILPNFRPVFFILKLYLAPAGSFPAGSETTLLTSTNQNPKCLYSDLMLNSTTV